MSPNGTQRDPDSVSTHRPRRPPEVVVGVDETPASLGAAAYGAQLAQQLQLGLRLVHAYGYPPVFVPYETYYLNDERHLADELLASVRDTLDVTGVSITREVVLGAAVPQLQAAATRARVLVVGHQQATWGRRLLYGDVASGLCSSSPTPVITVPEGWQAATDRSGPVVVALDEASHAPDLMAFAVAHAQATGTSVVVVHAEPGSNDTAAAASSAELARIVDSWNGGAPEVSIGTRLVRDDVAPALHEASDGASLLVVGREHHLLHLTSWALSVGRAVLRDARCPLAVVPVREHAVTESAPAAGHLTPAG
ncbi:MAG: universal stress protein [Nocardioidaceae bacterium]|nr:universal stress protein [Nocardioidaceae bacterium]